MLRSYFPLPEIGESGAPSTPGVKAAVSGQALGLGAGAGGGIGLGACEGDGLGAGDGVGDGVGFGAGDGVGIGVGPGVGVGPGLGPGDGACSSSFAAMAARAQGTPTMAIPNASAAESWIRFIIGTLRSPPSRPCLTENRRRARHVEAGVASAS